MGGDAADAVPAGIKALRAFTKAPSHLVSAPISRHDPRARRPPLFSSHPPPTIRELLLPISSPPTSLSSHRSQTASSALREGLCELAYPEGASGAGALDEVLEASAQTLDRLGGPKMTRASARDVRELAVLHTACKVLALRDEPRAELTAWTPRGLDAHTSAKRGLLDTTWLALLARRCECSHVDDSTRHQAIDEMIAVVAGRRDWDAAKRLARQASGAHTSADGAAGCRGGATTAGPTPAPLPRRRRAARDRRRGRRGDDRSVRASRDADDVGLLADVALGMTTTTPMDDDGDLPAGSSLARYRAVKAAAAARASGEPTRSSRDPGSILRAPALTSAERRRRASVRRARTTIFTAGDRFVSPVRVARGARVGPRGCGARGGCRGRPRPGRRARLRRARTEGRESGAYGVTHAL